METGIALKTLEEHGDGIIAHMAAARLLMEREPEAARIPLAASRWALVRRLRAFQLFKHREIFDPAQRGGDPARAERARVLAARCIALGDEFEAYVRRWSGEDVVARWAEYRPAMLEVTDRLRRSILAERAAVASLLTGTHRTRRLSA